MSEENVETLRRAIDAFNKRDLKAAASYRMGLVTFNGS
jgi:hypothetical protein